MDPGPHQIVKPDPDPPQSQNLGAVEARNGAMEDRDHFQCIVVVEAQNGAVEGL